MTFMVDGVKFSSSLPDMTRAEAANYVAYVRMNAIDGDTGKPVGDNVTEITVTLSDDGKVDVSWKAQGTKFERIRRITG